MKKREKCFHSKSSTSEPHICVGRVWESDKKLFEYFFGGKQDKKALL
jgi:hypothetical protein